MFSIVMPLYNKENCVLATIETVLSQTYPHFELLVVNDGSTDRSLEVVKNIKDTRIKTIEIVKSGVSNARNVGIDNASFDIISLMDADDFWEPNYLETVLRLFTKFPDADVVSVNHDGVANKLILVKAPNIGNEGIKSYLNLAVETNYNVMWSSAVSVKKRIFNFYGGFNTNLDFGEDLEMWFRLRNTKIVFTPNVLAHYNLGSENNTWAKNNKRKLEKTFVYSFRIQDYTGIEKKHLMRTVKFNLKYHLLSKNPVAFFRLLLKHRFAGIDYIISELFKLFCKKLFLR